MFIFVFTVSFFIQRAGTPAFAFSHPMMSVCALFLIINQIWITESRVWLVFCFWYILFMYDEYVCASAHVIWYILWILSVWCLWKLSLALFSYPVHKLYFSKRKSFVSHFVFTWHIFLVKHNTFLFCCILQNIFCLFVFLQCPPAYGTLMAMNTIFHTAALLFWRVCCLLFVFCFLLFVWWLLL